MDAVDSAVGPEIQKHDFPAQLRQFQLPVPGVDPVQIVWKFGGSDGWCWSEFSRHGMSSLVARHASVIVCARKLLQLSHRTPISELVIWLQPESRRVVARRVEEKPALVLVAGNLQPVRVREERAQRARVPDARVQLARAPAARVPAVRVQRGKPRVGRAHRSAHRRARNRDASSRFPAARQSAAPHPESPSAPSQLQNAFSV